MLSTNHVTLIGFLGQDAELKSTRTSGARFAVLSVATNRSWKDRASAEFKSEVSWHRCVVFGHAAEFAAQLVKGDRVEIEGEIRTRQYVSDTDSSGEKRSITEIRVRRIVKLERNAKPASEGAAA